MLDVNKKINILIPDGESPFTLGTIHCLSRISGINVHLVFSSKENIESKYSRFISSVTYYKKTGSDTDFIDFLKKVIYKKDIKVILPIGFYGIYYISKYRRNFNFLESELIVPSIRYLEKANDKWQLSKFLNENDINSPITINSEDKHKTLRYPILYKPLIGGNGRGIKIVNNEKELNMTIKAAGQEKFILQEFIRGYDIDCSILSIKGKILAFTIQKEYLAASKPFRPPFGVEFLFDSRLFDEIQKLIKAMNWSGVAHLDLRYDIEDKSFKIIDFNPRFWASVEASNKVGVNFPYLYILSSLGNKFEIPEYRFEKCVNNKGLIKLIRSKIYFNHKKLEFPENFTIKNDLYDPLPKIMGYSKKLFTKIF